MTETQFKAFDAFRKEFKAKIEEWNNVLPNLMQLQKDAAKAFDTPDYPFETPIVYNRALDEFTQNDDIKLIVIGDNPGKDEQLLKNNKYLVGQAGKLGEGFFRNNPELGVDFRKNVIILNKTPIHSAKTNQLKHICKNGGAEMKKLLDETQIWMAERTGRLAKEINAEIWLVGYSELKPRGIFALYRDQLKLSADWDKLFVYKHFSMNCFSGDLKAFRAKNSSMALKDCLTKIGTDHKNEIYGVEV